MLKEFAIIVSFWHLQSKIRSQPNILSGYLVAEHDEPDTEDTKDAGEHRRKRDAEDTEDNELHTGDDGDDEDTEDTKDAGEHRRKRDAEDAEDNELHTGDDEDAEDAGDSEDDELAPRSVLAFGSIRIQAARYPSVKNNGSVKNSEPVPLGQE